MIHGGVHASHITGGPANAANIVRELLEQGYVVVAPDYRWQYRLTAPSTLKRSTTAARRTTMCSAPASG